MDQEPLPIASVSRGQPYDFHDEKFVTWWLNSLYLFTLEDQLAIAQLLHDAVHAPDAVREIEAFLAIRMQDFGDSTGQVDQPSRDASAGNRGTDGILHSVMQIWRASPWTFALGFCALAFFLAKGLWFAFREGYRVIF